LEIFERYVGLMPFVALGKGNPTENLRAVAKLIDNISDEKVKSDVLAETYIISGLALDVETIEKILRKETMKESVTYQEIRLDAKAEGREEGIAENKIATALNMLHSNMSIDLIVQFTGLSVEEIERLRQL
jgi:predicted transposase/invertase (TIGR01784 family)